MIRRCTNGDLATIESIVNEAAEAYRGVIPADCWHEPYMSREELVAEIAAGVDFWAWELLASLASQATGPVLVGTWAAATWAIRFYERQGFRLVTAEEKDRLLDTYWTISSRQRDTSVVLAR